MEDSGTNIKEYIQEGFLLLDNLTDLYKKNIGLINALRIQSKKFMSEISDIEDSGLLNSDNPKSNFNLLLKNVEEFNKKMRDQTDTFSKLFSRSIIYFEKAIEEYRNKKTNLTLILEVRKRMLFTVAILEKLKIKIANLEHMNNILFSIPSLWNGFDGEYTVEMMVLHATISRAEDKCRWLIKEIESIN